MENFGECNCIIIQKNQRKDIFCKKISVIVHILVREFGRRENFQLTGQEDG